MKNQGLETVETMFSTFAAGDIEGIKATLSEDTIHSWCRPFFGTGNVFALFTGLPGTIVYRKW